MAINNPIIDAGPTIRKVDTNTTVCPLIESNLPGTFTYYKIVDGVAESGTVFPQWEGQLLAVKIPDIPAVTLYVAVLVPLPQNSTITELKWREVSAGATYEDPRTGEEKDPAYDLYFPLAS